MKPPPFTYHDPASLDEAVDLLASLENPKLLAGGQSLMPMLNLRLTFPDHVVDINRIAELGYVRESGSRIEIGAMTRQSDIERSDLIARRCPLMCEALTQVGHRQTRNRGTLGGSLCHLDPSAELPMVAAALDATVQVRGPSGPRDVAMADFPAFYMTPAIEPDEIVTGVEFEPWPHGHGHAFIEFARRLGDFAVVGVAVMLELSAEGRVGRSSIVLGGVGEGPVRCAAAETALAGRAADAESFDQAAASCAELEAMEDVHASADYRRHLARVLTRRALDRARERALGAAPT